MRILKLFRDETGDDGTLGTLVGNALSLSVIELPWRDNMRNRSCIPDGEYLVLPHRSPRFGRCLHITDVPHRSHVLFHSGNVAGDSELGFKTHSHGCILPGIRRGVLGINGRRQRAVLSSKTALRHLLAWAENRPFQLEVVHV